jgi:hypothetical protein
LQCRYKFTAEDVQRMVEEKRQRGGRNTAAERARLAQQMNYAKEQGDLEEAARCRCHLISIKLVVASKTWLPMPFVSVWLSTGVAAPNTASNWAINASQKRNHSVVLFHLLCRLQEVLAVLEARAKIDAERATRNNMAAVNVRNKVSPRRQSLQLHHLCVPSYASPPEATATNQCASMPSRHHVCTAAAGR